MEGANEDGTEPPADLVVRLKPNFRIRHSVVSLRLDPDVVLDRYH